MKGWVDETMSKLEFENEGNDKEYEVKATCDNAVYTKESDSGHYLPGLYYLVSWKGYPIEEITVEPTSMMLHLCKLISTFHRDYPEKPTAISPPIDSASPMARSTVRPQASITKRKRSRPAKANGNSKRAKNKWTSSFLSRFWLCLNSRQKDPLSHVIFSSAPLRSAPLSNLTFRFFNTSRFLSTFRFFLLGIGKEVFSINHLDLSVFLHQSLWRLEVFHQ